MSVKYSYILPFILFLSASLLHSESSLKLYSFYTPSHKVLLDEWFLPSLQEDFDLDIGFSDQDGSGSYLSSDWNTAILGKVDLIIKAIQENWGGCFIFSDVDIQFFRPIKIKLEELLKDNDIIIQRDHPKGYPCTGFFVCRGNNKNLQLWQEIKRRLSDKDYLEENPGVHDQTEFHKLVAKENLYHIKWSFLPESFFGGGTLTGKRWNLGDILPVPKGIYLHHANWTVGIENKIAQLEHVKEIVSFQHHESLMDTENASSIESTS